MSTVKKTASGTWHSLVYDYTDEQGKRHYKSITADTKAECQFLCAEFKLHKSERPKTDQMRTVCDIVDKYINLSRLALAPSTIARYEKALKYGFKDLMKMRFDSLTDSICQAEVNKESKRPNIQTGKPISPKTVREEWCLINTAFRIVCGKGFDVKLPQRTVVEPELPSPKIVEMAIAGADYELAYRLAFEMGLRMSEARGLEYKHIKDGVAKIRQTKVSISGVDHTRQCGKTKKAIRDVPITPKVQALIEQTDAWKNKEGFIVEQSATQLHHAFSRLMEKNGEHMTYHYLRHMWASIQLNILGTPIKYVQILGGWDDQDTLFKIYDNKLEDAFKNAINKSNDFYSNL